MLLLAAVAAVALLQWRPRWESSVQISHEMPSIAAEEALPLATSPSPECAYSGWEPTEQCDAAIIAAAAAAAVNDLEEDLKAHAAAAAASDYACADEGQIL